MYGRMGASAMAEALVPPELVDAPVIPDLYQLAVCASCFPRGLHMEFGVATGRSLRKIRAALPAHIRLYGFDSFNGLPEAWNGFPVGSFATELRVDLPNTELVAGTFESTLAEFVLHHPEPVSLMHIDCDLYSSTKAVLSAFRRQIVCGTVIIFDELFGFAGYETQEYKALCESGLRFETIGRWNAYRGVIRVGE